MRSVLQMSGTETLLSECIFFAVWTLGSWREIGFRPPNRPRARVDSGPAFGRSWMRWLKPEYFECLARHQVAHFLDSWAAVPSVGEQMTLPGSRTCPDLVAARIRLGTGRKYEQTVKAFEPYDSIKRENPEARVAGGVLVAEESLAASQSHASRPWPHGHLIAKRPDSRVCFCRSPACHPTAPPSGRTKSQQVDRDRPFHAPDRQLG